MGRVVTWGAHRCVGSEAWTLCGTREQGGGGFKSLGLSVLLDTAAEQLVHWPCETSEIETPACWTAPK